MTLNVFFFSILYQVKFDIWLPHERGNEFYALKEIRLLNIMRGGKVFVTL